MTKVSEKVVAERAKESAAAAQRRKENRERIRQASMEFLNDAAKHLRDLEDKLNIARAFSTDPVVRNTLEDFRVDTSSVREIVIAVRNNVYQMTEV